MKSHHRVVSRTFGSYFSVDVVPVLKDNYSYIVKDFATKDFAVVDVSEFAPVVHQLETHTEWSDALKKRPTSPLSVWSTHKHWDHSGGNKDVVAKFKDVVVVGGEHEPIPHRTLAVSDGQQFSFGSLVVDVLFTPCHTSGHVLYHVYHPSDKEHGAVFTGDTIFAGGIGAFFEGSSELMLRALDKFNLLPDETAVYPGHEYTLNFLRFAATVLPKDESIATQVARYTRSKEDKEPTIPSSVVLERQQNVFLKVLNPEFRKLMGKEDPVQLMQHLYDTCP